MNIPIGSVIKLICTNGVVEEGTLIEHSEHQLVLKLSDDSHSIIQNPYQNIVVIRVSKQEIQSSKAADSSVYVKEEPKPDKYYKDENLRAMKLAELHKLRAHEERRRAKEKLTAFKIETLPEVKFGFPGFAKPIHKHTPKKTR